jgi:hypothetical protein
MAVNVCRANPAQFTQIVKMVKKQFPAAKHASNTHLLMATMQKMGRLPPVKMDEMAFKACRQNNGAIVEQN